MIYLTMKLNFGFNMRVKNFFPQIIFIFSVLLLSACAHNGSKFSSSLCYKVGQEWTYDTRAKEPGSRVTIVDVIYTEQRQRIYIIRVTGVKIDSPHFINFFADGVPYLVISEPSLEASLRSLVGESKWNPHYDRYFQHWKQEGTSFTHAGGTIKEILNELEERLNIKLGA